MQAFNEKLDINRFSPVIHSAILHDCYLVTDKWRYYWQWCWNCWTSHAKLPVDNTKFVWRIGANLYLPCRYGIMVPLYYIQAFFLKLWSVIWSTSFTTQEELWHKLYETFYLLRTLVLSLKKETKEPNKVKSFIGDNIMEKKDKGLHKVGETCSFIHPNLPDEVVHCLALVLFTVQL